MEQQNDTSKSCNKFQQNVTAELSLQNVTINPETNLFQRNVAAKCHSKLTQQNVTVKCHSEMSNQKYKSLKPQCLKTFIL